MVSCCLFHDSSKKGSGLTGFLPGSLKVRVPDYRLFIPPQPDFGLKYRNEDLVSMPGLIKNA